jgi:hypothetical protein
MIGGRELTVYSESAVQGGNPMTANKDGIVLKLFQGLEGIPSLKRGYP